MFFIALIYDGVINLFYFYQDMVDMLTKLSDEERAAYILMERIIPPTQTASLVRNGSLIEVTLT